MCLLTVLSVRHLGESGWVLCSGFAVRVGPRCRARECTLYTYISFLRQLAGDSCGAAFWFCFCFYLLRVLCHCHYSKESKACWTFFFTWVDTAGVLPALCVGIPVFWGPLFSWSSLASLFSDPRTPSFLPYCISVERGPGEFKDSKGSQGAESDQLWHTTGRPQELPENDVREACPLLNVFHSSHS